MGERMSGGGDRGRRRAHPGATVSGSHGAGEDTAVAELLAAALRTGTAADADEGERRAVAAFRAARDSGAHRSARTRRRDDWRPRGQRHTARSVKATLSVLVASLTLGGVAVAAIGSAGSSTDAADEGGHPQQSASAPQTSDTAPSTTPSSAASADRDRPVTAQDTEARCRAYEQVKGRGRALDATAWQRLVAAAGGEENVAAYCAAQSASASPGSGQGRSGDAGEVPGNASENGSGNASGNGSGQQKAEPEKTSKAKGNNQ